MHARPASRLARGRWSRLIAAASILVLAGCAGSLDTAPSTTPSPSPSATPSPTPEPEPILTPLTGEEVDSALTTPALSAKIDDHPDARPQIGLGEADLVFEELVEGGLTRYVAVWHSSVPDEIGPVRSIRPMDPSIVAPLGGLMAYSGGQQRFVSAMQQTPVTNVIHGGAYDAYFHRDTARPAPHNVVLDAARLVAETQGLQPPPQLFAYATAGAAPSAQATGTPASSLSLAFSEAETRQWACDPATGAWARSQRGTPDVDEDGGALTAANVLVLRVTVTDNRDVPETVLAGSGGEGFVASGCASIPVTWSKADVGTPIVVVDGAGAPVSLAPGNSWIELVPVSGNASAA